MAVPTSALAAHTDALAISIKNDMIEEGTGAQECMEQRCDDICSVMSERIPNSRQDPNPTGGFDQLPFEREGGNYRLAKAHLGSQSSIDYQSACNNSDRDHIF